MQNPYARSLTLCSFMILLAACGAQTQSPATPATPATAVAAPQTETASDTCAGEQGLTYICGMKAPEDLLVLGSTGLLLASGQRRPEIPAGHMYLIDPVAGTVTQLVPSASFRQEHDRTRFPDCPGPVNIQAFSVHGMGITETAPGLFNIYSTSHGEREAIEIYDLELGAAASTLTWKGCVLLPQDAYFNGVARLADGGFVTTRMRDANPPTAALPRGSITGTVFEWHPGGTPLSVAGTESAFGNGIDISADERYMYVAASGSREVIRFDRSTSPPTRLAVTLPISPDNIHWGANNKLLTAGGNYVAPEECSGDSCATGWSVLELYPDTLAFTRLGGADQTVAIQNVSAAIQLGSDIWATTSSGDRIARFPRQVSE